MRHGNRPGWALFLIPLLILLLVPALILFVEGLAHLRDWPTTAPVTHFWATSLVASGLSLAIILAGGTPLAFWLSQLPTSRQFWAELLLSVPLLLPPLVIGLVLAYAIGPDSVTHLAWTNTLAGLVLAEVYEAGPYYVFVAWSAFRSIPASLWETALTLGFTPVRSLFRVLIPLAAPGLAVGAAMAWSRAIGAFGAPIVVSYHPMGLPVGIWVTLEEFGLPAALPVALLLVAASLPLPLAALGWARHVGR